MTKEAAQRSVMRRIALMKVAAPMMTMSGQTPGTVAAQRGAGQAAAPSTAQRIGRGAAASVLGPVNAMAQPTAAVTSYFTHAPKGTPFSDWMGAQTRAYSQDMRGYAGDYVDGLRGISGAVKGGANAALRGAGRATRAVGRAALKGWQGARQRDQNFVNTLAAPITYFTHAPRGTSYADWQRSYWQAAGQR